MESLENRKSAVTIELPKNDPQQSVIMNEVIPDTKTSVQFNKLSRSKSLSINANKPSEQHITGETKNDQSSDGVPNNSEEVMTEQSFHDSPDSVTEKSSEAVKKLFDKKPSDILEKKSSEEKAMFSQSLTVNNSIESVVHPANQIRNSKSFMDDNPDISVIIHVEKSKSSFGEQLNTPKGLIIGLFIALALALWYGIQNGRFKAFLTPALRGYESESSSAFDDASMRYHDILPFDAEPYDDAPNPTE